MRQLKRGRIVARREQKKGKAFFLPSKITDTNTHTNGDNEANVVCCQNAESSCHLLGKCRISIVTRFMWVGTS